MDPLRRSSKHNIFLGSESIPGLEGGCADIDKLTPPFDSLRISLAFHLHGSRSFFLVRIEGIFQQKDKERYGDQITSIEECDGNILRCHGTK